MFALLIVVTPVQVNPEVYVDARNGIDSNSGTRVLPFRTLTAAIAAIGDGTGTTIHVSNGVYDATHGETFPLVLPPMCMVKGESREGVILHSTRPDETNVWAEDIRMGPGSSIQALTGIHTRIAASTEGYEHATGSIILDDLHLIGKGIVEDTPFDFLVQNCLIESVSFAMISNAGTAIVSDVGIHGTVYAAFDTRGMERLKMERVEITDSPDVWITKIADVEITDSTFQMGGNSHLSRGQLNIVRNGQRVRISNSTFHVSDGYLSLDSNENLEITGSRLAVGNIYIDRNEFVKLEGNDIDEFFGRITMYLNQRAILSGNRLQNIFFRSTMIDEKSNPYVELTRNRFQDVEFMLKGFEHAIFVDNEFIGTPNRPNGRIYLNTTGLYEFRNNRFVDYVIEGMEWPSAYSFSRDYFENTPLDIQNGDSVLDSCLFRGETNLDMRGISASQRSCAIVNSIFENLRFAARWGNKNTQIINCTIVDCDLGVGGSPETVATNTIFHGNQTDVDVGITPTFCLLNDATIGEGNLSGNPLFVNPSVHDFHLLPESPCVDAGTSANAPRNDIDGMSRPQGSGFDIGAYEFYPATGIRIWDLY